MLPYPYSCDSLCLFTLFVNNASNVGEGISDAKGRWMSETHSISEEDAHKPKFELHVSPSITPKTAGHQNVNE